MLHFTRFGTCSEALFRLRLPQVRITACVSRELRDAGRPMAVFLVLLNSVTRRTCFQVQSSSSTPAADIEADGRGRIETLEVFLVGMTCRATTCSGTRTTSGFRSAIQSFQVRASRSSAQRAATHSFLRFGTSPFLETAEHFT